MQARAQYGRNELAPDEGARALWVDQQRPPQQTAGTAATVATVAATAAGVNTQLLFLLISPQAIAAGTPLWKLILKQFDDLLVKVGWREACTAGGC